MATGHAVPSQLHAKIGSTCMVAAGMVIIRWAKVQPSPRNPHGAPARPSPFTCTVISAAVSDDASDVQPKGGCTCRVASVGVPSVRGRAADDA